MKSIPVTTTKSDDEPEKVSVANRKAIASILSFAAFTSMVGGYTDELYPDDTKTSDEDRKD